MHDPDAYRIDFLMRHGRLTEEQAAQQVQAERAGQIPQASGPPMAEQIYIFFNPFHERPANIAEAIGHRPATWEAVWTAATEAGPPTVNHLLGRFESQQESPDEAIRWARERCTNVWIMPPGENTQVTLEEYLNRD